MSLERLLALAMVCITLISMTMCICAGAMLSKRDRYKPLSFKGKRDRREKDAN